MVKIVKRKNAKGGTLNISEETLKSSALQVDDELSLIPGYEQFVAKLRRRPKKEKDGGS